ncbi:MAG: ABC transporter substrate-binding protein, partial [Jaaginema sp. PMC 1079.18]|nr:ABC transporter substrate-binding protein [Jaaginema sp. PMC 1079.18]
MLNRRYFNLLLGAFLSFVLAVACTPRDSENTTGGDVNLAGGIPLGVAIAQTSNVALLGQEQAIGVKIAEAYFNKQDGINGTPIKIVIQDTAGDEQGAINAFNTLINQDKVVGIVGPT